MTEILLRYMPYNSRDADNQYFAPDTVQDNIGILPRIIHIHGYAMGFDDESMADILEYPIYKEDGRYVKISLRDTERKNEYLKALEKGELYCSLGGISQFYNVADDGKVVSLSVVEISLVPLSSGYRPKNFYAVAEKVAKGYLKAVKSFKKNKRITKMDVRALAELILTFLNKPDEDEAPTTPVAMSACQACEDEKKNLKAQLDDITQRFDAYKAEATPQITELQSLKAVAKREAKADAYKAVAEGTTTPANEENLQVVLNVLKTLDVASKTNFTEALKALLAQPSPVTVTGKVLPSQASVSPELNADEINNAVNLLKRSLN